MSSATALIRFKSTGNIYMGCYSGTSDIMYPYIFMPEDCYDEKTNGYWAITYGQKFNRGKDWSFPDGVLDFDYGGGFYWAAFGSESAMMVKCPVDEFGELDFGVIIDGTPEWVDKFWEEVNEKNDNLSIRTI